MNTFKCINSNQKQETIHILNTYYINNKYKIKTGRVQKGRTARNQEGSSKKTNIYKKKKETINIINTLYKYIQLNRQRSRRGGLPEISPKKTLDKVYIL